MTRKLLSAAALMVAVFFTGSLVAQAAEVTFGGQIRPRYEVRHQSDSTGRNNEAITMRTRLNTNIKVDENTSVFIQFQMNSTWGGAPFVVTSGNDGNTQVGLHQAYFTIKNLFGQDVTAKIGRQQIVLDGHRLFGHTGWATGGQSHDAAMFTHSHDNMTVLYAYSKVFEGTDPQDEADREVHILWLNMKGALGGNSSTSGYLVLSDDDTAKSPGPGGSTDFWTIGVRHAGGAGNIDYRGEFYYQNGQSSDVDINAFMVGLRAGYKMPNVNMKPKITLWLDYLSGTDDLDPTSDIETFNTLFDTGHKFYGLIDVAGPNDQGLIDLAIKLSLQPMAKTTLKVDLHAFKRAEDDTAVVATGSDDMGEEIDVTLIYKYSPSTKYVVGFSYFMGDDNFSTALDDDQSWFYIMADVKF